MCCDFLAYNWGHFGIVNYDKRTLQYEWDTINWQHNAHNRGEFYLRQLDGTVENEPIVELGEFRVFA